MSLLGFPLVFRNIHTYIYVCMCVCVMCARLLVSAGLGSFLACAGRSLNHHVM